MDRASIQERFGIVGSSDAIKNVIDRARQVAKTDITVLLQGESGVGKELIAQAIHELSVRRHEPMVVVNCGAIPEGLIESELFGAEKGAYTGAVQKRVGYFEEADGSTIFLDEIGEMPKEAQVRLLRVLETGKFSRVGSSQQQETDVRIVAATNKDLAEEVQAGRFRKDLYYRLSTVLIDIPPLRDRREDILPIFETFLHRFSKEYNSPGKRVTDEAEDLLRGYHWPGNVRELRNVAEQAVVLLREEELDVDEVRPLLRDIGEGSTKLMRVNRSEQQEERTRNGTAGAGPADEETGIRERELLYRAILEMRMEMRDMKEQIRTLVSNVGMIIPREVAERSDFPGEYDDFVVVRDVDRSEPEPPPREETEVGEMIRDVVYEVDEDEPPRPTRRPSGGEARTSRASRSGRPDAEPSRAGSPANGKEPVESPDVQDARTGESEADEEDLPTLEEAERQLISRALKEYDGNRRKTAQALGISERTLYRKLKDIDEDL
jgi:DNA-binding NtrC family response regulator